MLFSIRLGVDRGFVIEGKAHGHKSSGLGYRLRHANSTSALGRIHPDKKRRDVCTRGVEKTQARSSRALQMTGETCQVPFSLTARSQRKKLRKSNMP
jgi:hypothetical protein